MTSRAAGIGERLAGFGNKLPIVALRMERQLQNTIGVIVPDLTVGQGFAHGAVSIFPASAYHELTDAMVKVTFSVGILRSETLVVVIVAVEDDFSASGVQRVPKRLHLEVIAVLSTRAEQRLVKVSEGTELRVLGQVLAQPLLLLRACSATSDLRTFAVQYDDVPLAEIVAVVGFVGIAGGSTEIMRVSGRPAATVLVIPRCGTRTSFVSPPSWVVTFREIFLAPIRIRQISGGENRSWNLVEQLCGGFGALQLAASGDISRADQNWV